MDWSLRGCVLHYFSIGDNCCEGGWHSRKNNEGKVTNHVSQYILTIGLFSFVIETKFIVFLWSRYAEGKASSDSFNVYVSSTYAACSCKTVNTDYGHPMKLSKKSECDRQTWFGPKIQQTKMFVTCQRFGHLFFLGWSGSTLLITKYIIKVGSKS